MGLCVLAPCGSDLAGLPGTWQQGTPSGPSRKQCEEEGNRKVNPERGVRDEGQGVGNKGGCGGETGGVGSPGTLLRSSGSCG